MIHFESFDRCYGKLLPKLGTTRAKKNPIIFCKFYDTSTSQEWYIVEGNKVNGTYLFYGLIIGKEFLAAREFTLQELEKKGTISLSLLFKPSPLSSIEKISKIFKTKFPTI